MERKVKNEKRIRRHKRVRAKVFGTATVPRLCVFRSHKHIYAQLINDDQGHIILSASDFEIKNPAAAKKATKINIAYEVGRLIAEKAKKKKVERVIFDRGGNQYHGRVQSLAEGARKEGLKF